MCPGKEWKTKSTEPSLGQSIISEAASPEVSIMPDGSHPELHSTPSSEDTLDLQRKLEELKVCDSQNVIFPDHLNVPDAGKLGFCFGSFDANFGLDMIHDAGIGSDKSPPRSETSEAIDGPVKELQLRCLSLLPKICSIFLMFKISICLHLSHLILSRKMWWIGIKHLCLKMLENMYTYCSCCFVW